MRCRDRHVCGLVGHGTTRSVRGKPVEVNQIRCACTECLVGPTLALISREPHGLVYATWLCAARSSAAEP